MDTLDPHLIPTDSILTSGDLEKHSFDYIPLVIESVFFVLFLFLFAIFEVLIRKGVLFKESNQGPTKIHLQHLKAYKEQESTFLENGGQANKSRQSKIDNQDCKSATALGGAVAPTLEAVPTIQ